MWHIPDGAGQMGVEGAPVVQTSKRICGGQPHKLFLMPDCQNKKRQHSRHKPQIAQSIQSGFMPPHGKHPIAGVADDNHIRVITNLAEKQQIII